MKNLKRILINFIIISCFLPVQSLADSKDSNDSTDNPCDSLLSLVGRPSFGDSPCVVPMDHALFELGVQFLSLTEGGYAQNVPSFTGRIGLPGNNEFIAILPSYIHQTVPTQSGFDSAAFGFKHQIAHGKSWVGAVEGYIVPPSGSSVYGNEGYGGVAYGIYSYDLTKTLNIFFQLGGSTLTTSEQDGGCRYNSFNQDYVLTWQPEEKWQIYGEVFAQTKTAPDEGAGYIADVGFQYLATKYLVLDLEAAQRISGNIGGIKNFIGAGLAFEI